MTFIPNFGPVIGLLGPVFAILLSGHDMERLLYLLGLYAVIVVIDQLLLQPLLMKRVTRVPIWASLLVPLILGVVIPFWGVLLAPRCWQSSMPFASSRTRTGQTYCRLRTQTGYRNSAAYDCVGAAARCSAAGCWAAAGAVGGFGAACFTRAASIFLPGARIACSVVPSMRGMNSTTPLSPMS